MRGLAPPCPAPFIPAATPTIDGLLDSAARIVLEYGGSVSVGGECEVVAEA